MKMDIFWKQSARSGMATFIRMACAFAVNKFLAVVAGPVGFAIVGQLQNLINIGQGTSSLAMQNGWVSLTAQHRDDESRLNSIWRGGFRICVYASMATAIFFVLFAFLAPLSAFFPGVPERYMQAAILFAVPGMIALTLVSVCSSVMNGFSDYRRWSIIIAGSAILNALWVILFIHFQILSILSAVATQSIVSAIFALIVALRGGFTYKRFRAGITANYGIWRSYALMGLIPMILTPALYMFMRSFLGNRFGWDAAGFWQGALRISDFFNVAFSSVLGVVLLPRLSAAKEQIAFRQTLFSLLVRVMLIALALCGLLFILRDYVILFALSDHFLPLSSLLPWQIVGDFFKSGCWCLGLALVARKETVSFLTVEIVSDLLFVAFTVLGTTWFGYRSPFFAYALENAICFVLLLVMTRSLSWKNL